MRINILKKVNSLKKGEEVPLLNFEGGPGVPLFNFEGGPGIPLLNSRGGGVSRVPLLNFEGNPRSQGPEVQWSCFYTML